MRRLIVALVGLAATHTALSQDLLQCLHPDVSEGLARNSFVGVRQAEVTGSMPAVMSGISLPPEFEFIAASVGENETVAAFRTDLANDVAHESALAALEADGWQVVGDRANIYFAGDAGSPIPSLTAPVCRDDRRLTVGSRDIEGTSYVNYHFPTAGLPGGCGNSLGISAVGSRADTRSLEQFMPALRFPTDPATGQPAVARFTSSSGGSASSSSSSQVSIAMPIDSLAAFLAAQLGPSGWTADSSWAGSVTAGSTWLRQPDPDNDLLATLEVTARTPTVFDVSFSITQLNQEDMR
jgi:hypothetical protein